MQQITNIQHIDEQLLKFIPHHKGYDVVNIQQYEDIICPICKYPASTPLVRLCGHFMCKTCADFTSEKVCLICQDTSELRKLDRPEDKPLCNLIAKIQIKC